MEMMLCAVRAYAIEVRLHSIRVETGGILHRQGSRLTQSSNRRKASGDAPVYCPTSFSRRFS
jgi:hypothetical protein